MFNALMFGAFVHAADIDNSVTIYLCVSLLMSCNFSFFLGLVLVLFGILPAVMSWSDRYSSSSPSMTIPRIVPGGKLTLSLVIGGAGYIILSEILEKFGLP